MDTDGGTARAERRRPTLREKLKTEKLKAEIWDHGTGESGSTKSLPTKV